MKLNRIRTVIISLSGILIQPRVWVLVAKVAPFLLLPTIFLFNTEEEIDSFLKRLGIDPLHVRRTRETVSDYGFVRVTVICPRPAGNSFLLQYRLYDDEGGSCVFE